MSRSLFEITEDFIELEKRLDAEDDSDNRLLEWMHDLSAERQQKIDAYCWLIRKLETEVDSARVIVSEFANKQRAREAKIEALKRYMKQHMQVTQCSKLIGKQFTVALQRNGGSIPVEIDDEQAIPAELCEVKRVPLKTEIRAKLERGEYVPGARLGERGESVRIK